MNLSPFGHFNVPWPSNRLCKKAPSYLEATKTKWQFNGFIRTDFGHFYKVPNNISYQRAPTVVLAIYDISDIHFTSFSM